MYDCTYLRCFTYFYGVHVEANYYPYIQTFKEFIIVGVQHCSTNLVMVHEFHLFKYYMYEFSPE